MRRATRRLPAAGGSGTPTGTRCRSSASPRRRTITGHPRSAHSPSSGRSANGGRKASTEAQTSGATCRRSCRLQGRLNISRPSRMSDSLRGDPLRNLLGQETALAFEPDPVTRSEAAEVCRSRSARRGANGWSAAQVCVTAPVANSGSTPGAKIGVDFASSWICSSGSLVTREMDGRSITLGSAPGSATSDWLDSALAMKAPAAAWPNRTLTVRWPCS